MSIQYPRPTPSGAWFVHYIDADDRHQVTHLDGLEGAAPTQMRGESLTLAAKLYTIHTAGRDPPAREDHRQRYRTLRTLGDYAGDYSLFEPIAKAPLFQDSTPDSTPSPLLGFEPSYETAATAGFWTLLDGYEDNTLLEQDFIEIDLSVTYLATFEEYGPEELDALLAERSYTGLTV